jgi:hypothetical protein
MSYDCEHCLNCSENAIGESIAYCEVWDNWRNVTQGFCFGNCDMQYRDGEKVINKPMTNGDRIRAMTDEELTAVIVCPYDCDSDMCSNGTCFDCCMNWLQRPVKEDEI